MASVNRYHINHIFNVPPAPPPPVNVSKSGGSKARFHPKSLKTVTATRSATLSVAQTSSMIAAVPPRGRGGPLKPCWTYRSYVQSKAKAKDSGKSACAASRGRQRRSNVQVKYLFTFRDTRVGDRRLALTGGHQPPRGARHGADTPKERTMGEARRRRTCTACVRSERAFPSPGLGFGHVYTHTHTHTSPSKSNRHPRAL